MSLMAVVLILGFSFFPLLIEKVRVKFFIYLGTALVELLVFWYTAYIDNHKKYTKPFVYTAFFIFFTGIMSFGIYLGVVRRNQNGAIFLILLICSQVVFVTPHHLWNFLLNMVTVLVFSGISISLKRREIWQYDVANAAAAALISTALSWYISRLLLNEMSATRKLEEERNRFREESIRDELTGLSNRRDYLHAVHLFISVCQHVRQTICAIMMDVDYFKNYNDFYGHQKGDAVLQALGKVLKTLMQEDRVFAARVGGEEFIILWTENRIAEAERVAIKLQHLIVDLRIPHEQSDVAPYVTASIGLYVLRGGSSDTVEDLYNKADAALYAAKHEGRNCIMLLDSADNLMRKVETLPPEQNKGRRARD